MNFTCAICTDLLTPPDDIFRTPCGHIFHFTCLSEWLRRSPTCPQCREKTPSHKIHRLYFNFCNNDHITDEILSLRDKVNKLTCQLAQKVKDIKYYSEKAETIEKQIPGKKRETQDLLQTIDKMKQQLNYIRKQASETDSLKKTNKQLRKKLEMKYFHPNMFELPLPFCFIRECIAYIYIITFACIFLLIKCVYNVWTYMLIITYYLSQYTNFKKSIPERY
ncbi:E3 ubiquitin-protein ligase TRAIP isoform X3 [Megalopta genalis]|uniref:E3 ubiquitin-protein ligase TRAIP isoform X3 n=1 Tax=Megalopta genalis TaxID=115081 RepID=UPI003FD25DF8